MSETEFRTIMHFILKKIGDAFFQGMRPVLFQCQIYYRNILDNKELIFGNPLINSFFISLASEIPTAGAFLQMNSFLLLVVF
jgi:hypothetical protein